MDVAEVEAILAELTYRNWQFHVGGEVSRLYIQVQFYTGTARQHGRKWWLSPHMTRSEVVRTAFLAALTAEEHECRESFLYRGRPIFGPHIDVNALHEASEFHDRRRPHAG